MNGEKEHELYACIPSIFQAILFTNPKPENRIVDFNKQKKTVDKQHFAVLDITHLAILA